MTCSNSFFHNLFKGDNFPKDYFMFLLKVMQIFKALKSISQLKIDFEKIGLPQPIQATSMKFKCFKFKKIRANAFCYCHFLLHFFYFK